MPKERKFLCALCDKGYANRSSLSRHTTQKHPESRKNRGAKSRISPATVLSVDSSIQTFPGYSPQVGSQVRVSTQQASPLILRGLESYDDIDFSNIPLSHLNRLVFKQNWGAIRTHTHHYKQMSVYNFRIENGDWLALLRSNRLDIIMQQASTKFKLQVSLGFTLYSNTSKQLRYWHASQNNQKLFPSPILIENRQQFDEFVNSMAEQDVLEKAVENRPDTQWVISSLTNICFYVYRINNHVIGSLETELPQFMKVNRSLKCLDMDSNGELYNDSLCLMRCLSLHQGLSSTLEASSKKLFIKYQKSIGATPDINSFKGVTLNQLSHFEDLFKIGIVVYSMNADGVATLIRRSTKTHSSTMYLNLHQNHFSYITNLNRFTKSFKCTLCSKLWKSGKALNRHFPCSESTNYRFRGGMYENRKGLFELLAEEGLIVPEHLRYFEFRACYDCEVYFTNDQLPTNTKSTAWTARHELASISVCSNIPGFDKPKCFVSEGDEYLLTSEMMSYLESVQQEAHRIQKHKFHDISDELDKLIKHQLWKENEAMVTSGLGILKDDDRYTILSGLKTRLKQHLSVLPVFGFNSGRYDMPVLKQHITRYLLHADEGDFHVIKCGNDYKSLNSTKLHFLDISNYLAPGFSFDQYLRAFQTNSTKFFYPYEWFDSLDKLKQTTLPPHSAFFSSLKNKNITEEQYEECKKVWSSEKMETFKDYLVYYNNSDVEPFMTALEKQYQFYKSRKLDFARDGISIPGLAMKLLMTTMDNPNIAFSLFPKHHQELYHLIRSEIRGGMSIVWSRYNESSVTRIRGRELGENALMCNSCHGYDVSGMYLNNLMQPQPTGRYIRRRATHNFQLEKAYKHGQTAEEWLEWISETEKIQIRHAGNAREKRIGLLNLPVDGYHDDQSGTKTVFQFLGCYFHSHSCKSTPIGKYRNPVEDAENLAKTMKHLNYISELGYEVRYIWECQWNVDKKMNSSLQEFCRKYSTLPDDRRNITQDEILKEVQAGTFFGMVQCSIRVPIDQVEKFSEFQPIVKHAMISREDIGSHMRSFAEEEGLLKRPVKSLICSYYAENILIATPLLKWYLDHGLVVDTVIQTIQYFKGTAFRGFGEMVMNARREGDADPSKKIVSDSCKLIGNSAYGRTLVVKERQTNVRYINASDEQLASSMINQPSFKHVEPIGDDVLEFESSKRSIQMDVPIQIGFFVLEYAKLTMLRFYYDMILKYIPKERFQLIQADTDSLYIALSTPDIFRAVSKDLRNDFVREYHEWFALEYCPQHEIEFFTQKFKGLQWSPAGCCQKVSDFDKRSVGRFHLEWSGKGMIALCSKSYFALSDSDDEKYSSKGLSHVHNQFKSKDYKSVLDNQQSGSGVNKGFRVKGSKMYTYTQTRKGLSYLYCKRRVCSDGCTTLPTRM